MKQTPPIYLLPKNYHPHQGSVLTSPARLENIFLQRVQQNLLELDKSLKPADIKLGMFHIPAGAKIAFAAEAAEPDATCRLVETAYRGNLARAEFFVNSAMSRVRELDPELSDLLGWLYHSPASLTERGNLGAASQGFYLKIQSNILENTSWAITLADAAAHGIIAAMPDAAPQ